MPGLDLDRLADRPAAELDAHRVRLYRHDPNALGPVRIWLDGIEITDKLTDVRFQPRLEVRR